MKYCCHAILYIWLFLFASVHTVVFWCLTTVIQAESSASIIRAHIFIVAYCPAGYGLSYYLGYWYTATFYQAASGVSFYELICTKIHISGAHRQGHLVSRRSYHMRQPWKIGLVDICFPPLCCHSQLRCRLLIYQKISISNSWASTLLIAEPATGPHNWIQFNK